MRGIEQEWLTTPDPAEREAIAANLYDEVVALAQSPGWTKMADAIERQVTDALNDLARTSEDDEQNRGVIRALRHVLSMPENLIRAASLELDKHRS